ncbi:DUF5928 domain-containing protein [Phaeobacter sp.]|uniref:DUF5928 domain-containing protein n=1 Tax=Phaeobacter sp. TaxID=1902409 RepID=UPI0025F22810|nr:DUF5928 domain-containing protein [Phaeobacter sp.]
MAKIAYVLLCHKDPDAIIAQAERLTAAGDCLSIHFDGRASDAQFSQIRQALKDNPKVCFAKSRIKCGWGEWSLVEATLQALQAAVRQFGDASHFYLISGDCMAIKTAEYAHRLLDSQDCDYIESFDFFKSDWIKTGMKEDRLFYRHFFNERSQRRLFEGSYKLQQRLGLKRRLPEDLDIQIGSQWWCLRRNTVEAILAFLKQRPDVIRFFRTTWIPDETFFQTLVRHLVPKPEINCRTLTFLMFSDYGMPVQFYNDHYDLLLGQDFLFARKISEDAADLKSRLGALYAAQGVDFQISDEGRNLYKFLAERGRVGLRFAPRFWETESTLGRERELLIVTCKKWHVAKRLLAQLQQLTDLPALAYLFDEDDTAMPSLGGIETSVAKRSRHRRALMRMLFDSYGSNRLVICVDPGSFELMADFCKDRAVTRVLQIECSFDDSYLIGHAGRIGLAGPTTSAAALERLLPAVRNDINHERDRIRDADFADLSTIREGDSEEQITRQLGRFFAVSDDTARALARTPHLFTD